MFDLSFEQIYWISVVLNLFQLILITILLLPKLSIKNRSDMILPIAVLAAISFLPIINPLIVLILFGGLVYVVLSLIFGIDIDKKI